MYFHGIISILSALFQNNYIIFFIIGQIKLINFFVPTGTLDYVPKKDYKGQVIKNDIYKKKQAL